MQRGALHGTGSAVELSKRQPEIAHLALWNVKHPFIANV
jgi:hypothetical protein